MDRLPHEIYKKIFNLIPHETVLECTHVCHKWTDTAQQCLRYHVWIHSQESLDKLIKDIELKPSRKNQIKHFYLTTELCVFFDKRIIYHILPNLQSIVFILNQSNTLSNEPLDSTKHWKPTIKNIIEKGDFNFTYYLIESNLCARLEKLELSNCPRSRNNQNPAHQLKNMPSLKNLWLDIHDVILTLNDFEILHQNVPSIVDFRFNGIISVQNRLSANSIHASAVKMISWDLKCAVDSLDISDRYIQCFQYIRMKYCNLESLYISYSCFSLIDMENIFRNGWLVLLQFFGSQIKHVGRIDVPSQVNIFKLLDDFGCKIENLSIFSTNGVLALEEFKNCYQCNYIQELHVADVILKPSDSLKYTKLVSLRLHFTDTNADFHSFTINHLLKICPETLKTLILENAILHYDGFDKYQCFSLTTLEINNNGTGWVEDGVKANAYIYCPNLKKLSIYNL